MSHIRFGHVFAMLMVLSALCAFVVPAKFTDPVRGAIQNVFAPVSRPVRAIASAIDRRLSPKTPADEGSVDGRPRSLDELVAENTQLRIEIAHLTGQLNELREISADRELVGDILPLCKPFTVVGADSGSRDSILITGSSLDGLRVGMPVLYSGGVVGRVDSVGAGGARVRLITDKGFAVDGQLGTFNEKYEWTPLATSPPLVRGNGRNTMRIEMFLKDVKAAGLDENFANTYVVVNDATWSMAMRGYRLGRVVAVNQRTDHPLHAEIIVQPDGNLMGLREVLVLMK